VFLKSPDETIQQHITYRCGPSDDG
jgi:hypothetical protein